MYTIEQVATEIEQLKPDLTEFLKLLVSDCNETLRNIPTTQNIFIKLLKTEIGLVYIHTHPNNRYYSELSVLEQILITNLSNHGVNTNSPYTRLRNYIINDEFNKTYHILAHIKEPRQYLPKYLWDKVRTVKRMQKEPPKPLQPDAMSLHVFKTYLQNNKNLTSVEATFYLTQLKDPSFDHIREDFMDVIFSKCPKPSIDLQKNLAGQIWNSKLFVLPNQNNSILHKYMALSRQHIKNLANNLNVPITTSVYDTLDSAYKPFITGLYRTPDTTPEELSYLFSALVLFQISVLKEPNPVYSYFIECLTNHLQAPESATIVNELKQNFSLFNQAVAQLQL